MKVSEIALILGALVVFVATQAQNRADTQEWSLRSARDAKKVQLTVEVDRRNGFGRNHWRNTHDIEWAALRGIGPDQLDKLMAAVKFDILRDAGTLHCEGRTGLGRASGTFRFEPNAAFSKQMRELGYSEPTDEQMFSMAMHDVSLAFARKAVDAGLQASTKELIEMRVHGIDEEYIGATRDSGYPDLTARNLIDFRIHGVSPDFLGDLRETGYRLSPREVVEMRIHGVSSEFIAAVRAAGYKQIDAGDIRDMRIHGVSVEYLRALKNYGLTPKPRELIEMRIHGIDPEFLRSLRDAGYQELSARETIELKNHGVPGDFVREAKDLGFEFTPKELTQLRTHGVNGAYLRRLKDSGFGNLTADKIVKLRIHGVD
jgi:hypothetical protein